MDITILKDKLENETFSELSDYITSLTTQRDAARRESIDKRKTLQARVTELEGLHAMFLDKLGIADASELDSLEGKPALAEVERQYQARLKRMEADLKAQHARTAEIEGRWKEERTNAAINAALAKHPFVNAEDASVLLRHRMVVDGDEISFKTDEGHMVSVDEGAAWVAKTRPHLVRAQGAGGSGMPPAGTAGTAVKNPWSKDHFNLTEQGKLLKTNPQLATQYQEAVGA